jgi:molybdopterin/thiamine biosynthesis adenylyltransferase
MKKVVIVGVGALGSHVVQLLRNEAALTVVDFDRVEQKNVLSQFHSKPQVGKLKTDSVKATMNFLFALKVNTFSNKLVADNATQLLGGQDLVVDCLDNGAARRVVQDFVRKNGVPCLHGALAPDGGFGRVIWDEQFVIDDETGQGAATCEGGEHLPFIGIVSAYIARAAQEFLTKGKKLGFSIAPSAVLAV